MTKKQKTIFIVDDNNANLAAYKNILKTHYVVYPVPSAQKMFDLLGHVIPDMILLDVDMPDMNGYEAAGRLKKNDDFKTIPIVFLSSRADATSETFGLNMGALDYIHKPIVSELLLRRLEMHLSVVDYQKMLEEQSKSSDEPFIREELALLNDIISTLNSAANTDDAEKIKNCLARALEGSNRLLAIIGPDEKSGETQ